MLWQKLPDEVFNLVGARQLLYSSLQYCIFYCTVQCSNVDGVLQVKYCAVQYINTLRSFVVYVNDLAIPVE